MNRIVRAVAPLIVAAACGTGTDSTPVTPPTSPPTALQAPLGKPTGVRVVDIGRDFIEWAWNPVEGAAGYEVAVFMASTPPDQRGEPIITAEPTVRAEGLELFTEMEIRLRAFRETAGDRIVGPWSDVQLVETLPAPLVKPPGVRVVERGQDFIEWAWDPVRGATRYEVEVFPAGTPPGQRGELIVTTELTVRTEGLKPGTDMEIYVRAARETEDGHTVGPWSETFAAATLREPLICTDERRRAIRFSRFVREWDGTPFRVDMIRNFPAPATEADLVELLDSVRLAADRIEGQLGYRILEMGEVIPVPEGVAPGWNTNERRFRATCPLPRDRGQIQGFYMDDTNHGSPGSGAQANSSCGSFCYLRPFLEYPWPCRGCEDARTPGGFVDGITLHEIFHVLGFAHFDDTGRLARGEGVPMSRSLTWVQGPDAEAMLWEDIDTLRCVFPTRG